MFIPRFAPIIGDFLRSENGSLCCLLNLSKTKALEFERIAAVFIDGLVTGKEYDAQLRGDGWLFGMDRYGCASDVGEWCMYCEKDNDIAVVGLRNENSRSKFRSPLKELNAEPIESVNGGELAELFPFIHLTPQWRRGLIENYGSE